VIFHSGAIAAAVRGGTIEKWGWGSRVIAKHKSHFGDVGKSHVWGVVAGITVIPPLKQIYCDRNFLLGISEYGRGL
jgi:hypothetical protein